MQRGINQKPMLTVSVCCRLEGKGGALFRRCAWPGLLPYCAGLAAAPPLARTARLFPC